MNKRTKLILPKLLPQIFSSSCNWREITQSVKRITAKKIILPGKGGNDVIYQQRDSNFLR